MADWQWLREYYGLSAGNLGRLLTAAARGQPVWNKPDPRVYPFHRAAAPQRPLAVGLTECPSAGAFSVI
jgi:hypothetical protein